MIASRQGTSARIRTCSPASARARITSGASSSTRAG